LRELDLPFELVGGDLQTKKTASGDDFNAINPKSAVPALQLDDGEVLTEGVAIAQFSADHYAPGTLAPAAGKFDISGSASRREPRSRRHWRLKRSCAPRRDAA
jgi:glutathione S-transferase